MGLGHILIPAKMPGNVSVGFVDLVSVSSSDKNLLCIHDSDKQKFKRVQPIIPHRHFTVVPIALNASSPVEFGRKVNYVLSRVGDCLRHVQMMFFIPEVKLRPGAGIMRLRWTRNLAHNLIRRISLIDLTTDNTFWSMDSMALDHINAFKGQSDSYYRAIGNVPELTNPTSLDPARGTCLPARVISIQFDLDNFHGSIFPILAVPYSQLVISIDFRDWTELLILDDFASDCSRPARATDLVDSNLQLKAECRADYLLLAGSERNDMSKQIYHFVSNHASTITKPVVPDLPEQSFVVPLRGLIHTLYFGLRNVTNPAEHSNYSTRSPILKTRVLNGTVIPDGVDFYPSITAEMQEGGLEQFVQNLQHLFPKVLTDLLVEGVGCLEPIETEDPLLRFRLEYAGMNRLDDVAEFFSQVHPMSIGDSYPRDPGYHMYTFGEGRLQPGHTDAFTNFSKLESVTATLQTRNLPPDQKFQNFVIGCGYELAMGVGGAMGSYYTESRTVQTIELQDYHTII